MFGLVRLRRPSVGTVLGGVALILAMGGVAYATIPSNGVISGCYTKSGGTLRVIDATTGSCSPKETSLNWNVQGAAGPQGPAGATGEKGAPGEKGDAGVIGPQGPAGISGFESVTASSENSSNAFKNVTVHCPSGKKAISGGAAIFGAIDNVVIRDSSPNFTSGGTSGTDVRGWSAGGSEVGSGNAYDWSIRVWAQCAMVQ